MRENEAPAAGVAERLYYDDPALCFHARVTDIQLVAQDRDDAGEKRQLWRVALDRTAFYPESGGQPWDTGELVATARSGAVLTVPVERVEEDEAGEVWHLVRKPLVAGTEVEGRVDADRRMDHTQQHSGQHLLSAVLLRQTGARTVSFHLGGEASTIDLALLEGMTELPEDVLRAAEAEVNRVIYENRPVTRHWYSRPDAEALLARGELTKLPDRHGPLRVIEIEGVELNACGGTHVRATGSIGGVVLRGTERVRKASRLEFLCGARAVRAAQQEHGVLSGLARSLSVSTADVPGRVSALQEAQRDAAKETKGLLEELAATTASRLLAEWRSQGVIHAVYHGKPLAYAKRIALALAEVVPGAVIGCVEDGDGALVLALRTGDLRHAGKLLQGAGPALGVRGGGATQVAQGTCEASHLEAAVLGLAAVLQA